jgi:Arc/MetJ-type ribon-helix-helix transcriptional regulator
MKKIISEAIKSGAIQDMMKKEAAAQAEKQAVNEALASAKFKRLDEEDVRRMGLKKGGYVKKADGCAKRGKTKGRMV